MTYNVGDIVRPSWSRSEKGYCVVSCKKTDRGRLLYDIRSVANGYAYFNVSAFSLNPLEIKKIDLQDYM